MPESTETDVAQQRIREAAERVAAAFAIPSGGVGWIEAVKELQVALGAFTDPSARLPIMVWRFSEAPAKYQSLTDPDDVDWLALVPHHYSDDFHPLWLHGSGFAGSGDPLVFEVPEGWVYVGRHA